ncbi:MAG: hypothetical protein O3A36_02290 [bacterium]|nr:hypothetical protein [bacterium]
MNFPDSTDIYLAIISLAIVVVSIIAGWVGILLIRTLKNIQKIMGEFDGLLHFLRSLGMIFSRSTKKKKK